MKIYWTTVTIESSAPVLSGGVIANPTRTRDITAHFKARGNKTAILDATRFAIKSCGKSERLRQVQVGIFEAQPPDTDGFIQPAHNYPFITNRDEFI